MMGMLGYVGRPSFAIIGPASLPCTHAYMHICMYVYVVPARKELPFQDPLDDAEEVPWHGDLAVV